MVVIGPTVCRSLSDVTAALGLEAGRIVGERWSAPHATSAQPNAGNLLLLDHARLGMFDFGSVRRLDATLRRALQRLLLAVDWGIPRCCCCATRFWTSSIDRIGGVLEAGSVTVSLRLLADARDRSFIISLVHQFVLAFMAATTGVIAVLLLGLPGGPRVTRERPRSPGALLLARNRARRDGGPGLAFRLLQVLGC